MLPLIGDDGYMNVGAVLFFTSYTIVVNWTLLQVRKAPTVRLPTVVEFLSLMEAPKATTRPVQGRFLAMAIFERPPTLHRRWG